jgi:hypothetical protein
MRYFMLVLFLSAPGFAQAPLPPAQTQLPDKPPAVVELLRPDAVLPGESAQGGPDLPGVTRNKSKVATGPTWHLLPSEQTAKPPSAKWKLFPFGKSPATPGVGLGLLPSGGRPRPAFVFLGRPGQTVVTTQPQPCSIPLTNVLRPGGRTLPVRQVPIPSAQYPMTEVPLPAPPCDDRK